MKSNRLLGMMMLLMVLAFPTAYAIDFGGGLSDVLGDVGKEIADLVENDWFRFGLTFILVFMIMYAIYAAGLNKVAVFKGKKDQPTRQGKIIAASLGLITALGFAYWANFSAREFTERILSVAGWFGAVAFSLLVFALAYFNMRDEAGDPRWPMILFTTGLGMVTYSVIIGDDGPLSGTMGGLGLLFIIIGLLFMIINAFGSRDEEGDGGGNGDRRRAPSRVSNFNAAFQNDGSVLLSWDANPGDENITSYEVERQVPGTFGWRRDRRVGSTGDTSIVDNAALDPNQRYRYRIQARNDRGLGPAAFTALEQHHDTVQGDIFYRDHRGDDWPIDDLDIQLTGPASFGPVRTDGNGHFSIDNVPRGRGNYNLRIGDRHGVYRDYDFNDLVSDDQFNIGRILISPRDGVYAAIQGKVVDPSGSDYANQRLDAFAVGGFGRVSNTGHSTDSGGHISVTNVPAGHVANMYCIDPTGTYALSSNPDNDVLLRRRSTYALPNSIQLQHAGVYDVSGDFFEIDPTGTRRKVPNCMSSFTRNSNDREVNNNEGPTTDYTVTGLSADTYTVRAEDITARFRPLRIPYRDRFLVHRPGQRLNIRMIPNSPVPGNVRIERDGSGQVIARIEFS